MDSKDNRFDEAARQNLLLRMYDQMFNDINRHINVVWQPITTIVGSAALLAAGTREVISIDVAEALIIGLVGWLMATLYDSSYWYNRNLVIIANIERQFLKKSDLKEIHYYFGKHRAKTSMLTHLRIQWWLGLGIGLLILLHHFLSQVLPILHCNNANSSKFHWEVILPYVIAVLALILVYLVRKHRIKCYQEFKANSPGINVDTTGIEYGVGHPTDDNENQGGSKE